MVTIFCLVSSLFVIHTFFEYIIITSYRVKSLVAEYCFDQIQLIKFDIYDCGGSFTTSSAEKVELRQSNLLGSVESTLAAIVKSSGSWEGNLSLEGKARGTIFIRTEELCNSNCLVNISLKCKQLQIGSLFRSRPNCFLLIKKQREGNHYISLNHRSC